MKNKTNNQTLTLKNHGKKGKKTSHHQLEVATCLEIGCRESAAD